MTKKHQDIHSKRQLSRGKSKRNLVIVGIISAVIVAGGVGAYSAMSNNGGGDSSSQSNLVGTWHDVHGVGGFLSGDDSSLYLATHNGLFKKGMDTGNGWNLVGSDTSDLMGFTVSLSRDNTMYSSGHPASMGGNLGFRKSTDGGLTWQTVSPVTSPTPVDFHAMDASPADGNLIYGSPGGGDSIYVTHDEGKTWDRLSPPAQVISLAAHATDANTVYAGTDEGLFVSNNQGQSWQNLGDNLVSSGAVTGLGFANDAMYAFVVPEEGDGYIAKSSDWGKTWSKTEGQISGAKGAWKFAEGRNGEVYTILVQTTAFGGTASTVYKTTDGGTSWTLEGTNNKSVTG